MKNNKKLIVMSTLLMAVVLLGAGTIAYFRRVVNGNVTGNAGNLVLIVNEANAVRNETFTVSLNRSTDEPYVMPGDSGTFDININANGSTSDVAVSIALSKVNLPDNLKFYLDSEYKNELVTYGVLIKKSNDMTKTVPVYWYWDGSIDDVNDSLFMGEVLEANVSVSATIAQSFYNEIVSLDSTLDTDIDFSQPFWYSPSTVSNGTGDAKVSLMSSDMYGNGNGLMVRSGTENDTYPIYYFRGDVNYNNVIYAGFCWVVVRTTETGGVKILYNGEIKDDGSCDNYSGVGNVTELGRHPTYVNLDSEATFINRTTTAFNTVFSSPVYAGYMYNDTNLYTLDAGVLDVSGYKSHLIDNSVDTETGRHVQNLNDSNIKTIVDDWYRENIYNTDAERLLEDTVWCNDRSLIEGTYSIDNYAANNGVFGFRTSAFSDYVLSGQEFVDPTFTCARDMDKFTVDRSNGNGDLTYKIGFLTADEVVFAGNPYHESEITTASYLTLWGGGFHMMSVNAIYRVAPFSYYLEGGNLVVLPPGQESGVRPAVSLSNKVSLISGDGSFERPYVVG